MNDLEQPGIDSPAFRLRNGSLGLSLRFSPEALAALTTEIGAGFVSVPRRGAEVGGILAGEMTQEGSEWQVAIDQITPVPIQYQYGPSYRLSAADKNEFQQLVNPAGHSSRAIGWYRSNTRPEQGPEEADRQISQTFFGAQSIFLFCKPSADGRIHASCIIILPRRVEVAFEFELGKFSRLEALFHARHEDADEAPPVAVAPVLASPVSWPSISLPLPIAAPVPPPSSPYRLISRNLHVVAAVLAMVGGVWYARGHVFTATMARANAAPAVPLSSAAAPAPGALLGLRADYQKDSLLIGWNRAAPEVASAASATFRIADGARTRTLNLSARELQNGGIVYKPQADEISVELNVTSRQGATTSQSIRIVSATLEARSPADLALRKTTQETSIPAAPRPFQPPPDVKLTEQHEIAPADVPPIAVGPAGNRTELMPSSLPLLQQTLPEFTQTGREFHPPEPLHRPQPALPAGMRLPDYAYDRLLQTQVEVTIAPDGRVKAARLIGESGPYSGLLGPSALDAARNWRFRPATLGGEPIESTMVLTFRYARPR